MSRCQWSQCSHLAATVQPLNSGTCFVIIVHKNDSLYSISYSSGSFASHSPSLSTVFFYFNVIFLPAWANWRSVNVNALSWTHWRLNSTQAHLCVWQKTLLLESEVEHNHSYKGLWRSESRCQMAPVGIKSTCGQPITLKPSSPKNWTTDPDNNEYWSTFNGPRKK